jgi:hypothetical protein
MVVSEVHRQIPLPSPFKRGKPKDASLFGTREDRGYFAFYSMGEENSKPLSLQERGLERGLPDPVTSQNK